MILPQNSVVIVQALELLQSHWHHRHQQPLWPQQHLQPYIIKELLNPDGWIIPGTKMTNTGCFFCGMDHQKSNFSLISYTLSVEGC
jgi:hypothetical protein